MPKFTVVYVKGRAVSTGMSFVFEPTGGRLLLEVQAASRADAYIEAYNRFTKLGLNVSVDKNGAGTMNPLGLTDADIARVESEGISFDTRAASGARIIKIIRSEMN